MKTGPMNTSDTAQAFLTFLFPHSYISFIFWSGTGHKFFGRRAPSTYVLGRSPSISYIDYFHTL